MHSNTTTTLSANSTVAIPSLYSTSVILSEAKDLQAAPEAPTPPTYCEECHVHEALPKRTQIIVKRAIKAVQWCAVCQEKYFAALPINRATRRQIAKQLRLAVKHKARHERAKMQRAAKKKAA